MAQRKFSEVAMVEEIKFNEDDKKRMQPKEDKDGNITKGERGFGENFRMSGTGEDAVYFQVRSVGGEATRVEEGDFVVTYQDGSQSLMSAKEFEKSGIKAPKKQDKGAIKAAVKESEKEGEATDLTLADRAAAEGNTVGAQSDKEARLDSDIESGTFAAKEIGKDIVGDGKSKSTGKDK